MFSLPYTFKKQGSIISWFPCDATFRLKVTCEERHSGGYPGMYAFVPYRSVPDWWWLGAPLGRADGGFGLRVAQLPAAQWGPTGAAVAAARPWDASSYPAITLETHTLIVKHSTTQEHQSGPERLVLSWSHPRDTTHTATDNPNTTLHLSSDPLP